ncbi:MAG TPA: nucleotidyltransferase family protein [Acidimicrobiales bacterium]|nr:nucleotidyltransferase family protein [Acidimicrobiales bacterium]
MTAAILLCAGGSTRFTGDQHKLLAPFRGRPLVAWALEHVSAAAFDEVIVVLGAVDLSRVLGTVVVVNNPEWASGQASSLHVGIAAAEQRGHEVVVVGLGDQPFVPPSAWSAVANTDSPIVVASFAGQRTPPVRLARDVWSMLPSEGDVGARELMLARPDLVIEIACDGESLDIDTVEDLARWS